ncbi:MAG: hypothetical protein GTO41_26110 [Burkholderiales bacterium]|nr:hypothetical protein [Burkholderiales bacterium]
MTSDENNLFEAFRADHATLGMGFHELSAALRNNDLAMARKVVERLDTDAGAHIAFEEENFYKVLEPLVGAAEVEKMYREHEKGCEVMRTVVQSATLSEAERNALLKKSEAMEEHIAECGDLFAAMGRLTAEEQEDLYQHLLAWRELAPRWTDFVAGQQH